MYHMLHLHVILLTSHITKRQEANIFKHEQQFIEDWL